MEVTQAFLDNFGVRHGKRIGFRRYVKCIEAARKWFGPEAAAALMDDFMPEGPAVEPGYEDSCSFYRYDPVDESESIASNG